MVDDRLDKLDYYTLLRIGDDATADEIRDAFHRFALKYHPDRHVGSGDAKLSRAAQIYRRGAEAYRVLLDPEKRRLYDLGLAKGRLRYAPDAQEKRGSRFPTPGSGKIGVHSAKARPFASKAERAIREEDWKTARLNLKVALSHEPDNPLLEARLAEVEKRLQRS